MRKWAVAAAILAVAGSTTFATSSPAGAVTFGYQGWVWFDVAGVRTQVPITVGTDENGMGVVNDWVCDLLCEAGGFAITDLDLFLDPDPIITFSSSVIDFGGPSTFGFVFMQDIVPTAAPGLVRSSFSGSTTNSGGPGGTVTVTPAAPPPGISQDGTDQGPLPDEVMVYSLSTNGGASWMNAGLDLGPAFTSDPSKGSDNFGDFNEGFIAGPAGAGLYNKMRVDVSFSLSGGNDAFTFNGDAEVIPEPSTAALFALGMALLAAARRRATR